MSESGGNTGPGECFLGPLAATIEGSGPPVVLLHGNGEDRSLFDGMAPWLVEAGFTVIRLDSRGHGLSPRGGCPMSLTQFAVDTARALTAYRRLTGWAGRFGVVGFSDGANVALELALHRPSELAGQVLMGGNRRPGVVRPAVHAGLWAGFAVLGLEALFNGGARRRFDQWRVMMGQPLVRLADLRGMAVPSLVMAGAWDVVPRRESLLVARTVPCGEWVQIQGAGHMVPVQRPVVAATLAGAFLHKCLDVK
ncbi:MAG: alpha/beta hydrolase [Bifidobacteriaceae bacterium]|jgi:pimeloyl-ACP methyl ester carboxylesterase|nr:alpha/beta hydrolase [Bifidobacteriaceae bacterium]